MGENNDILLAQETHNDNMIYKKSILSGKVHHSLEDPVSQLFYDISDQLSPHLHGLKISPNMVTLQRFIVFIIGFIYFFEKKMYRSAALIYMYAYFCDCLDGHLSRKYNMETTFGDYFDHITDIVTILISVYFIALTLNERYRWILFIIMLILGISLLQTGCQERYLEMANINKSEFRSKSARCLCPQSLVSNHEIEDVMEITKFFGPGTYHLFIMILIWNFDSLS
jgi:phosphatidylglycerophosphate synthase